MFALSWLWVVAVLYDPRILPWKAKMQYLLTLQVSRYCLLTLHDSIPVFYWPCSLREIDRICVYLSPGYRQSSIDDTRKHGTESAHTALICFSLPCPYHVHDRGINPENTTRSNNVGLMLGQRRRRWPNINPTFLYRVVVAGNHVPRC